MSSQRVRIRFSKTGDLKLISHRDMVRAFERLFRRAGVELAMSQGFHPRPLMTFPDALALGVVGLDEVMDLTLAVQVDPTEFRDLLDQKSPPGLRIKSVELLGDQQRKVKMEKAVYELTLPVDTDIDSLEKAIQEFTARDKLVVERKDKQVELNLTESLDGLWIEDGRLLMSVRVVQQSQLQPRDILAALGLGEVLREGATLTRTKIELTQ